MKPITTSPSPEVKALVPLWNSAKVRSLIDASDAVGGPSTLEVGRLQHRALINHLTEAFGSDSFTKRELYYMGLRVEQVNSESHLAVSGNRRLNVKKRSDDALEQANKVWQFRA